MREGGEGGREMHVRCMDTFAIIHTGSTGHR